MGFEMPLALDSNVLAYPFLPVGAAPGQVVKLQSPQMGASEYFLVENRQQIGFDTYLPASAC
jgi:hypothetical protein